jgi:3D-(3,5/4)-trihydroxycyclohexane-1,2-dione acylhydrolase (decyclizing)
MTELVKQRITRARAIASAKGIQRALDDKRLPGHADLTLSEAVVLGLIRQGVRRFIGIFGHGVTDIGEVLRIYEEAGVIKTFAVRHETEAVHAATALRWVTGEKSAVFTSIGPGALHALAGSLAPLSDGLGIWFLLGDETTEDEGPNMQQIPGHEQDMFLRLFAAMGKTYKLHTPKAVGTALRRGMAATEHPYRAGPFFLLLPMNTQPTLMPDFNFDELPSLLIHRLPAAADNGNYQAAVEAIAEAKKIVVKIGGGARNAGAEIKTFLDLVDGVAVTSPLVSGVIPFDHPRNMTVGGAKGSISGNYAMEEADMLVVAGSRFVCQSDCSRTGYPKVRTVININGDMETAMQYGRSIAMVGDVAATLRRLNDLLALDSEISSGEASAWLKACRTKRSEWDAFRKARYDHPCLHDEIWQKEVLTQPAAIKTVTDWARENDAKVFFDAGDVQANGFQIVEDDRLGRTFTETGASYMGFAVSALLSTAMADHPFYGVALSGDGSFVMNPQILIDGIEHGATGCIVLLDNRRMAAISGLQEAQYGIDYATSDSVEVDYIAWARAVKGVAAFDAGYSTETLIKSLCQAKTHRGLSMVYIRVYAGSNPLGGMGVFGRWNVGSWCESTQSLRHEIGL